MRWKPNGVSRVTVVESPMEWMMEFWRIECVWLGENVGSGVLWSKEVTPVIR